MSALVSTASGKELSGRAFARGEYAIALGCFDGVHVGHARLFSVLSENANGKKRAVWTFAPPKRDGICPVKSKPLIFSYEKKLRCLAECGVEYAFLYDFPAIASLSCEEFVERVLIKECSCGLAVCGYNFTFGRGASGNAETLRRLLAERGIETVIVDDVQINGMSVSSNAIRTALMSGDVETAEMMLGREYTVDAPVVSGKMLGRELGFPTVNQSLDDCGVMLRRGVYVSVCTVEGKKYPAVTNIGVRPTVSDGERANCETHIIGFSGDVYGEDISVAIKHFLRDEKRFDSKEELKKAVLSNIESARIYCKEILKLN